MTLPDRPLPQNYIPPLTKGTGLLPWTDAYTTARDTWTASWRTAVASWTAQVRALQHGLSSADFGSYQMRGLGSDRNFDYVAKRWASLAGQYVVGGKASGGARKVAQFGVTYEVKGLNEWLAKVDAEFRARILEAMDRRFAAWLYRQMFHEKQTISYPGFRYDMIDGKWTKSPEIRSNEYTGWPAGSGFSRASVTVEWDNTGAELLVRMRSKAPYTLAAPVTRAAFWRIKRNLKQIIPGFANDVKGELEKHHA
ncbi:MAG: hypothetical protein WC985_03220 [Thermoplasmata archaeon]